MCCSRGKYLGAAPQTKVPCEFSWRAPKAGEPSPVSPFQPTRGSRGALWAPPAEARAEHQPEMHFGIYWRPHNAPFCTYMLKYLGSKAEVSGGRGQLPLHCPKVEPCLYSVIQSQAHRWAYTVTANQVTKRLIYLFKITRRAAISGSRQNQSFAIRRPVAENNFSNCTNVAGCIYIQLLVKDSRGIKDKMVDDAG